MSYIVVLVTAPDEQIGGEIARALVEEKFAACVNIIRSIRSIYSWEGRIEDDSEVLLVIKTTKDNYLRVEKKVKEMHSYTVPEVIALPIDKGSEEYLNWIKDSTV